MSAIDVPNVVTITILDLFGIPQVAVPAAPEPVSPVEELPQHRWHFKKTKLKNSHAVHRRRWDVDQRHRNRQHVLTQRREYVDINQHQERFIQQGIPYGPCPDLFPELPMESAPITHFLVLPHRTLPSFPEPVVERIPFQSTSNQPVRYSIQNEHFTPRKADRPTTTTPVPVKNPPPTQHLTARPLTSLTNTPVRKPVTANTNPPQPDSKQPSAHASPPVRQPTAQPQATPQTYVDNHDDNGDDDFMPDPYEADPPPAVTATGKQSGSGAAPKPPQDADPARTVRTPKAPGKQARTKRQQQEKPKREIPEHVFDAHAFAREADKFIRREIEESGRSFHFQLTENACKLWQAVTEGTLIETSQQAKELARHRMRKPKQDGPTVTASDVQTLCNMAHSLDPRFRFTKRAER